MREWTTVLTVGALWGLVSCSGGEDGAGTGDGNGGTGGKNLAGQAGSAEDGGTTSADGGTGSGEGGTGTGGDGDGGTAGAAGSGGSQSQCPASSTCAWNEPSALSCDAEGCCSGMTCLDGQCVGECGQGTEELEELLESFRVVANVCGFGAHRSLVREGACDEPATYSHDSAYFEEDEKIAISIRRSVVSPFVETWTSESVYDAEFSWDGVGAPSSVPANFAVNPSETRLVFWITDLGTGMSQMYEVDLETDETRSLSARYPGQVLWIDDSRFLQVADGLEEHIDQSSEGLYLIDTSGDALTHHFVAGRFSNSAVLGMLPGDLVLTGGSAIVGGTDPALGVIPLATLEAVVEGERAPVDLYGDGDIQRFQRGEVWQHYGALQGNWFVAPSNSEYTEYHVEVVSVDAGTVSFGAPIALPFGTEVFHLGADRYALPHGSGAAVLELR